MKVLYDLIYFSSQEFGGISRMWLEHFMQLPNSNVEPVFLARPNDNMAQEYLEQMNYHDAPVIWEGSEGFMGKLGRLGFWRGLTLVNKTRKFSDAIFHSTDYINPLAKLNGLRTVTTIHDMVYWDQKERFEKNIWYWDKVWATYHSLRFSDAVVAVSETTRQAILTYFPWAENKVHVIHHGVGESFRKTKPEKQKSKRFLFLGGRNHYKNYNLLVEAFSRFAPDYPDWTLHVTGANTFANTRNAELEKYKSLGIAERVVDHGLVDQETLIELLAGSRALVIPSLNEGFNFPLIEAMSVGTHVLSSNIPVSLELGKDHASFFSPTDGTALLEAMRKTADSPPDETELMKAMEYAHSFTWEDSFEKLCGIYEQVLN